MNRENLTPTTVVDKNGRRTTVHKRSGVPASSSQKLATVKLQSSPAANHIDRLSDDPDSMEYQLKQFILNLPKSRQPSNKRLGTMLDNLHCDTLDTLSTIQKEWTRGTFVVTQSLRSAMYTGSIAQVNNLAFFYDKNLGEDYQKTMFHTYVHGVQEHVGLGVDATTAPESTQKSMRALLIAALNLPLGKTNNIEVKHESWNLIPSTPLGKLIMDRPEDVDRIVKIITDRPDMKFHNVFEIETLRELLEQDVPNTLSDGVI